MKHPSLKMSASGDIPIIIFDRDTGTTIHPGTDHATHALTRGGEREEGVEG